MGSIQTVLTSIGQAWKQRLEAGVGKSEEISFASESCPLCEQSKGDDLAAAEGGWWPGACRFFGQVSLAEVIDAHVQCGQKGVLVEHSGNRPLVGNCSYSTTRTPF